jgi:hypothetical protein
MKKRLLSLLVFLSVTALAFSSSVQAGAALPLRQPMGIITYSLPQQPQPPLTAVLGSPSPTVLALLVSGSDLTGNINVAAPAGFELSLASTGPYAATQSLAPQSGGFISNVGVAIRLTGAALGTFSGNISLSSANSTTVDVAVTGLVAATANPAATLTGLSPTTAMPGTTAVHFYGSNFVPGAVVSMYNNGAGFTVGLTTFISSGHLTAPFSTIGVNAPVTTYCYVSNPGPGGGGTNQPGQILFTAVPGPPTITSFSPTIGLVGTLVTINGVGFVPAGPDGVYFNASLPSSSTLLPTTSSRCACPPEPPPAPSP